MAGRKEKYRTHVEPYLDEIYAMCQEGLIEIEICKRLGISLSSLSKYKKEFSELSETLKKGKKFADYRVEDSLYNRAIGYEYTETTKQYMTQLSPGVLCPDEDHKDLIRQKGPTKIRVVTKHLPPDITSIIFWLKNRCPDRWRDKKHIKDRDPYNLSDLSDEELDALSDKLEMEIKQLEEQ